MQLTQKQIQHLYWRTGFGISYSECKAKIGWDSTALYNEIWKSAEVYVPLNTIDIDSWLSKPPGKDLSKEKRDQYYGDRRDTVKRLNRIWFNQMLRPEADLREKMSLFWHDHFACEDNNPYLVQRLVNTIRENGLGNFRTLLLAVSRQPAMIGFLNNQQNLKANPNENFGRELLELFTIGKGNYTESDVKEAARAFTGWQYRLTEDWEFFYNQEEHDEEVKEFMGQSGNFSGEDIIDILLSRPETASFIAQKIYRYLVSEEINESHIALISEAFYDSGYEIKALLDAIFLSDWFYSEDLIGAKIKTPHEYMIGLTRVLNVQYPKQYPINYIQELLGQELFYPPNVGGWPKGMEAINNFTLLFRMKLPEMMLEGAEIGKRTEFLATDDYLHIYHRITGTTDITPLYETFEDSDDKVRNEDLASYLLQPEAEGITLEPAAWWTSRETAFIDNLKLLLQSPEYQLC